MKLTKKELQNIVSRIDEGIASDDDLMIYNSWCNSNQNVALDFSLTDIKSKMLNNINFQIDQKKNLLRIWTKVSAAAVLLVCISVGLHFYSNQNQPVEVVSNMIKPGGNGAILTLANGSQVALTKAKNGQVATQGQMLVNKLEDGKIVYQESSETSGSVIEPAINTLSTPRGNKFKLILPDGTLAWLNAASSITFPTVFRGKERHVSIIGEVYFEVAHNAAVPFRVTSGELNIEVLGTHFNVSAYADEPFAKTTLLEGSVKIVSGKSKAIIKPGEQAVTGRQGLRIIPTDVHQETAWLNGNFQFENNDITSVMRQLSRWYDVRVIYESNVPNVHYTGIVPQRAEIVEVLNMLTKTGNTRFKVDKKEITVK
ncbi:MAG: FecR domain-containing protein [Bacteroidota bacterium]